VKLIIHKVSRIIRY